MHTLHANIPCTTSMHTLHSYTPCIHFMHHTLHSHTPPYGNRQLEVRIENRSHTPSKRSPSPTQSNPAMQTSDAHPPFPPPPFTTFSHALHPHPPHSHPPQVRVRAVQRWFGDAFTPHTIQTPPYSHPQFNSHPQFTPSLHSPRCGRCSAGSATQQTRASSGALSRASSNPAKCARLAPGSSWWQGGSCWRVPPRASAILARARR